MEIFKVKDVPILFEKSKEEDNIFVNLFFHIGASHEKNGERGISHLVEHLATRGGSQRKTKDILRTLDSCGSWNAQTSWDETDYYAYTEKGKFKQTMQILYDSLFKMNVSDEEFEIEKGVIIQELKDNMRTTYGLTESAMLRSMYNIDVEVPIIGKRKDLDNMTKEQADSWRDKHYRRKNMAIYVRGGLSQNYLKKIINDTIDIRYKGKSPKSIFRKPLVFDRKDIDISKKKKARMIIDMSYPIYNIGLEAQIKNEMFSSILNSQNSNLAEKLRTENGLIYSLFSTIFDYEAFSHIRLTAECDKQNFEKVYGYIISGINSMIAKKNIKKKLDSVKSVTRIKSRLWYEPENENFFKWVVLSQLKNKKFITQKETTEMINSITLNEIYEYTNDIIGNDYSIVVQEY